MRYQYLLLWQLLLEHWHHTSCLSRNNNKKRFYPARTGLAMSHKHSTKFVSMNICAHISSSHKQNRTRLCTQLDFIEAVLRTNSHTLADVSKAPGKKPEIVTYGTDRKMVIVTVHGQLSSPLGSIPALVEVLSYGPSESCRHLKHTVINCALQLHEWDPFGGNRFKKHIICSP